MKAFRKSSSTTVRRTRRRYSPIGIDFGSGRVKLLQLRQQRGKILPQAKNHFPTPPESIKNGEIVKPEVLLEQLKLSKQKNSWHGHRACLSMDSRACYTRVLTLPPLKNRELKKALLWEAEKNLPFRIEDAVISSMSLDTEPTRGRPAYSYLLAAVLKETADRYAGLAQKAGFNPVSLEIPLTAWLRSLSACPANEKPGAKDYRLFIDCGYSSTLLLLTAGRSYCFHRILRHGIKNFCRIAGPGTEAGMGAALRLVFNRGNLSEKNLLDEAARLARGISASLAYWSDLSMEGPLSPVSLELSGGGMLIPGLPSYLQQELGLKARFYDFYRDLNYNQKGSGPGPVFEHRDVLYSAAHGLVLRGWLK